MVVHTLVDEQVYWAKSLDDEPHRLLFSVIMMMTGNGESKFKRQHSLDNRERERDRARTSAALAPNHVGVPISKTAPAWIKVVVDREASRAKDREWHFELMPERQAAVQRIWEDAASYLGIIQIAAGLNRDLGKFPPFGKSRIWTRGAVQNILSDARVIGLYQPMRYEKDRSKTGSTAKRGKRVRNGEPFPYYPAAISADLYRRGTAAIKANHKGGRGRHGPTFSNLLKGLLDCSECGGKVHHLDRPGPHSYLQCNAATVRACLNREPFPYHRLEPLLFRLHEVYRATGNILPRPVPPSAETIAACENRIKQLRESRLALYRQFGDGKRDTELAQVLDSYARQIEEETTKLHQAHKERDQERDQFEIDYHSKFLSSLALINSNDPLVRLRNRKALWGEFRRIIERATLYSNYKITILMKRRASESIQIEYVISPDRIEGVFGRLPDGSRWMLGSVLFHRPIALTITEFREHAERVVRANRNDSYELAAAE